jgi:tetratricopeptide (TPR) repeat protein
VKALLDDAQHLLNDKRVDEALALLDTAVSINPDNIEVWLAAGDMTFSHGHFMLALEKYYIPGVNHTQPPLEPIETQIRSRAGPAFYMLAADPGADQFLLEQSKTYPEADMPQLAYQRWRIFNGQGDAARDELMAIFGVNQRNPAAYLIMGDFFLSIGRPAEAGANYKLAQELDAPAPQWIRLEAECNLQRIRDQKAETKLQPSCNEPPVLLMGRP